MKIITGYPVILNNKELNYSNANGKRARRAKANPAPEDASNDTTGQVGGRVKGFVGKVQNAFNKVKSSGVVDSVKNLAGNQGVPASQNAPIPQTFTPAPIQSTGMSTGAKIGIGIGVALLIGGIAFYVYKKNHK